MFADVVVFDLYVNLLAHSLYHGIASKQYYGKHYQYNNDRGRNAIGDDFRVDAIIIEWQTLRVDQTIPDNNRNQLTRVVEHQYQS